MSDNSDRMNIVLRLKLMYSLKQYLFRSFLIIINQQHYVSVLCWLFNPLVMECIHQVVG